MAACFLYARYYMNHALFEVLTGTYSNGAYLSVYASELSIGASIQDHLSRLLNARKGTLSHMPEYGLPDIAQIYQRLPYSVSELVILIREAIEKYEPRLSHVNVSHKEIEQGDWVLVLDVSGVLKDGIKLQFSTYFLSGGNAKVTMARRSYKNSGGNR